MSVRRSGVIRGKRIEIDAETDLPDGASVEIEIHAREDSQSRRARITDLAGAWSGSPELDDLFAEIFRARTESAGRPVDLDGAP